ncbi:MAG: TPM domain-containing protein [Betaproteobacteria bacterium]|nr:TPM domain-containing protein [Betaproteobacteria bacterium]
MANRWHRHLTHGRAVLRRAFPAAALRAIETEVGAQEARHHGEMRFVVEASLPLGAILRGASARERALELFGRLGVAGTRARSGVLLYVLLAERAVEIVADRGIAERVPQAEWQRICDAMRARFAGGDFEAGALEGVRAIGALLAQHFPAAGANPNELPDRPLVL